MHRRFVGGGKRVGEQAQAHAVATVEPKRLHADCAGDEVGRDNVDLEPGGAARVAHNGADSACSLADARAAELVDRVGDHLGIRADEHQGAVAQFRGCGGESAQALGWLRDERQRKCRRRRVESRAPLRQVASLRHDRVDRPGELAVPVGVERVRQAQHRISGREHVEVEEVAVFRAQEVLVADVAAAEDGEHVVGDEHLVVHAVVDATQLVERRKQLRRPRAAKSHERIDEANLHPLEGRKVRQQSLRGIGVQVVDQDPHADASCRRVTERAKKHAARCVGVQDEGLQVEGPFRLPCQLDPRLVGCAGQRQQLESRGTA